MDPFALCLDVVLDLEPTTETSHLGLTRETWQHYVGVSRAVTLADVLRLTRGDVEPLYAVFWKGCSAKYLPAGVNLAVFDLVVNNGVKEGNVLFQRALGQHEDGLVGPDTLNAAMAANAEWLIDAICDLRDGEPQDRIDVIRVEAKAMAEAMQAQSAA